MKYATWKLNFAKPNHGTGPEEAIVAQGFTAVGLFLKGEAKGGTFLGYFTGNPVGLEEWNFQEVTLEEALLFASELGETLWVSQDDKIVIEIQGE